MDRTFRLLMAVKYVLSAPWHSVNFEFVKLVKNPDQYIDHWIRTRKDENGSLGLVVGFPLLVQSIELSIGSARSH